MSSPDRRKFAQPIDLDLITWENEGGAIIPSRPRYKPDAETLEEINRMENEGGTITIFAEQRITAKKT